MKTMKASDFKARCLAVMDEVAEHHEPVLITKNGKPVAELRAHTGRRAKSPIGLHRGQVRIKGDILAPLGAKWEALD
ncbi:MAG: type II toxin-antitoxin system Phd/YefM family antitoxin [Betaproteobacteria bacterium]|nr:type II toxin-antitoxin system Phd/YefM family antitoxin [Betaproteobacteria bacterium]